MSWPCGSSERQQLPLRDVDLPLHGGACSPNGRGGGTGRGLAMAFSSSWSRAVGSRGLHSGGRDDAAST
jgi:hypothetical protein